MAYPAAAARLVESLDEVAGLSFDAADLHRQAKATEARLEDLLADSDEHRELVHQLELHVDQAPEAEDDDSEIELRSGDELAAEFERFLREQGD